MNYTKWPWEVDNGMIMGAMEDGCRFMVADFVSRSDDACLITSAPDMYEAIKEYLEWGPMTGSDRDLHEAAFKAAIARAEGKYK